MEVPAKCLVLSPHLDDAVFSAWSILRLPADVQVLTVFAGFPPRGYVSPLDAVSGATESAARVGLRRGHDRLALATIGRTPTHANLLDAQYRAHDYPALEAAIAAEPGRFLSVVTEDARIRLGAGALRRELSDYVDRDRVVYAPLGVGRHPDHQEVAAYGLSLLADGFDVLFFADIPYLMRRGLPSWLGQRTNDAADADADYALTRLGFASSDLHREVVSLPDEDIGRKIDAARRYATEFEPANKDFGGILTDYGIMQFEVYWTPKYDRQYVVPPALE